MALGLALGLAACGSDDAPPASVDTDATTSTTDPGTADTTEGPPDDALTWWRDVEPIVRAKCAGCHRPGEVAPFSLETHADFVAFSAAAAWAIESGAMPPWGVDDTCNDYRDPLSLTPEQREVLLRYVDDALMPEGDPADATPPEPPPPALVPDVVLEMPEAYTPSLAEPDDYRCFTIPWPQDLAEDRFVTGLEIYPGETSIVHHVIVYAIEAGNEGFYLDLEDADPGPGYTCFGGPGKTDGTARWVGAWVPGQQPFSAPEGVGQRISPGTTLVMQVHYNVALGAALADRSSIGLSLSPSVERRAHIMPLAELAWLASDGSMLIPAGDPSVVHEATFDRTHPILAAGLLGELGVPADTPLEIWNVGFHMHNLGTQGRLDLVDPGGDSACLLDIYRWDFEWQRSYDLVQPVRFDADQQVHLRCQWDNSANNQPVVDGQPLEPADVDWGDGTLDEMCLGILYVSTAR
ncbi:MAG: monooxygenase [Myxococcales bacterium]|nr:monooxygenase [Myxococcales bacterium]